MFPFPRLRSVLAVALIFMVLPACVSKKKYREAQRQRDEARGFVDNYKKDLTDCRSALANMESELKMARFMVENERRKVEDLEAQLAFLRSSNNNLLDRMAELNVVSQAGAESIRKSLETINERNQYIRNLTNSIQRRDSINLALVSNLKRSLGNDSDQDVTVEVRKGVVYISISDKLLFKSGSSEVSPRAEAVLAKIARVLNDHKELEILVEGHTDNVPISTPVMKDNWDLSVARATSVVRTLQTKYGIAPNRMVAGGRGEFAPKVSNQSADGRAANRRTEIIVLPTLDQFFALSVPPAN